MIDYPDNPDPATGYRNAKGHFQVGNKASTGRGHGNKGKLSREIHDLLTGTIARRGRKYRMKLIEAGVDVEGLSDAECWIDYLDEDQVLKVLTHMLPKGVELTAVGEDGETVRPIIVMFGSKEHDAARGG